MQQAEAWQAAVAGTVIGQKDVVQWLLMHCCAQHIRSPAFVW